MTLTKKTVPQIKSELDALGVMYRSNLRKAELLSLLEANLPPEEDSHYSPPYTRRRTTMAAVDLQTVTSNLLKLDSSPLNHASAVIDELKSDTDRSEEVSVDVHITKEVEDAGEDEHVILQEDPEEVIEEMIEEEDVVVLPEEVTSNGTSTASEEASSEVTDSDAELEKEVEEEVVVKKAEPVVQVRRRSERIKKKHEACSGALFSDDDELPSPEPQVEVDGISATSSQDALASERKSMLLKIFLLLIVFAVVSNLLAYIYLSYPSISDSVSRGVSSFLGLFKSSDSPKPEL